MVKKFKKYVPYTSDSAVSIRWSQQAGDQPADRFLAVFKLLPGSTRDLSIKYLLYKPDSANEIKALFVGDQPLKMKKITKLLRYSACWLTC